MFLIQVLEKLQKQPSLFSDLVVVCGECTDDSVLLMA